MKQKRKYWFPLCLLFLLILTFISLSEELRIVTYTLSTNKVSAPIELVLLTDLHSCYYGEQQSQLAEALAEISPDGVCLGGDIFDDVKPHNGTLDLLKAIADKYPCYYITGNHEHWSEEVTVLTSIMRSYGVTVLEGNTATLTACENTISISGIDDPTGFVDSGDWYTQLDTVKNDAALSPYYTILLSHRPEQTAHYTESGFDLVLSGHAHGGQIRIPFLLNGLFAPNQGFFPDYAGGMYTLGNTVMIVSRGLCKNDLPRVWNRPELVVIHIVPEEPT